MQLANPTGDLDQQQMPPSIYAAMVDSLFINPAPMIFGSLGPAIACAVIASVTGDFVGWLCVPLFVIVGLARALQMYRYKQRNSPLTVDEAAIWEKRYQRGAIAYGITIGIWSVAVLLRTNDAAAHMLCATTVVACTSGGVGRAFGRPRIFHIQISGRLRTPARRADVRRRRLSHRACSSELRFLHRDPAAHLQPPAHLPERLGRQGTRGGAGRPVRYGPEQHAARPVHVPPPTDGSR